ncbi:MAG: hypothetical protein KH703_07160 [Campylobacter gracilis]|uniref:hypothetical protein n=1 Tax=Campylobacter gracilis TaxID=824 RepID=UPI0026F36391|nr:hypothetical protein [Campylobacter gracilis]MBS6153169.1 hypothetical protein [Campylobacter gracilis]
MSKFLRPQSLNDSICGDCAFAVSQISPYAKFYPFKFIALICGILHRTINFHILSQRKSPELRNFVAEWDFKIFGADKILKFRRA